MHKMNLKKLCTVLPAVLLMVVLLTGCAGDSDEQVFMATPFQPPEAVREANDSLTAYARSAGRDATFEEFKAIYEHFIDQYPGSAPLHMDLQALYNNFGYREEKIAHYRELYEQHPDSAMYVYLYARALAGPQVDTLLRKAYQIDSTYYWSNFALAARLYSYPPYDTSRAIELYERCIKLDASYPAPFRQLAILYKAQGNYDRAMQFADLFAIASQNALTPLLLQADIWELRGNLEAAEQLLRAYAAENPQELAVHRALVELYEKQGNYDNALQRQYEVARLSRPRAEAFVKLAELYAKNGSPDSAVTYVLNAAQQGFNDYRRIDNVDAFQSLEQDERYDQMMALLKEQADKQTTNRLASFAALADSIKQAALADTVSEPLPDVNLQTLSGESVSLDSFEGDPTLLLFWSSWSNQAVGVLSLMREFAELKPEGVDIVTVNMWDDDLEEAQDFFYDRGYPWDFTTVNEYEAEQFGVIGVPTVLIADADGIVRFRNEGYEPSLDQILLWQVESLD